MIIAAFEPKSTAVADARLVPVIVTDVPPVPEPDVGVTLVIDGAGGENDSFENGPLPNESVACTS